MMRSLILGSVIIGFSCVTIAAIESVSINDAKSLREKLTGQKKIQAVNAPVKKAEVKKTPAAANKVDVQSVQPKKNNQTKVVLLKPAQKGLALAREAKNEKNYILAIKRYNFILKYFSKTSEARQALLDKSQIYKDMGLEEQAQYNKTRAQKMVVVNTTGNNVKK